MPLNRIIIKYGLLVFLIISNVYFVLANIPLLTSISRQPAGTKFPLYHAGSIYDYNVYLSVITLGENNYWLNRDAFTSEKTNPGIFYFYYILVGKAAAIFNLWQPYAYHLARIITLELFIIATYSLSIKLAGKYIGFWASIISLIGTRAPEWFFKESGAFVNYTPWWAYMDGLKRIDGLPHHIFGEFLLLISLWGIFSSFKTKKRKYIFFSIISVILTGFFLPFMLLPLILALPVAYLITTLFSYKTLLLGNFNLRGLPVGSPMASHPPAGEAGNGDPDHGVPHLLSPAFKIKEIVMIGLILASAAIPILISFWQMRQGFPWNEWTKWEVARWNSNPNFDRSVIFSWGILPIIAIPAVIKAFKTKNLAGIFLFVWGILPIVLLPFANFLSVGKVRLFDAIPFLPWAILGSQTIWDLWKSKKKELAIGILVIYFISTLPISFIQLNYDIKNARQEGIHTNVFIPGKTWNAIDFLNKKAKRDSVILSNEYVGNIIPAYTPLISYFGHIDQTMNFSEKQVKSADFFTQKYSDGEAMNFLRKNGISYVYYGADEMLNGGDRLTYSFLKPVFQEDEIIIYNVKL